MSLVRIIGAVILGLASAAAAQNASGPFSDLGGDSDKPVNVSADRQDADFKAETVIYQGNVRVVQGEMTLRADTVTAVAPGAKLATITAEGDVILTSKDATARAPRAVYDVEARRITLTGGVVLVQDKNTVRGTTLVVELKSGKATLTADGGRVEGVFQPPPAAPKTETPAEAPAETPAKPPSGN